MLCGSEEPKNRCVQAMAGTDVTFSSERDTLFMQLIATVPDLAHPSVYVFARHDSMCRILAACVRSARADLVQELLSLHEWPHWFSDAGGRQQGLALALLAVADDDRSIDATQRGVRASAEFLWQTIQLGCGLRAPV